MDNGLCSNCGCGKCKDCGKCAGNACKCGEEMDKQIELKSLCEKTLFELQTKYAHQDITEFARVEDALHDLIKYGIWPK